MHFYGIMSNRPTCLYRSKDKNFVIIQKNNDKPFVYEVIENPLSKKDALDICTQEDQSIAKMMLEMNLYGKIGSEDNVIGKEKEIIQALGNTKEVKMAITLLKSVEKSNTTKTYKEDIDANEQQAFLEEINNALGRKKELNYEQ